jgi:hypothetical protein
MRAWEEAKARALCSCASGDFATADHTNQFGAPIAREAAHDVEATIAA